MRRMTVLALLVSMAAFGVGTAFAGRSLPPAGVYELMVVPDEDSPEDPCNHEDFVGELPETVTLILDDDGSFVIEGEDPWVRLEGVIVDGVVTGMGTGTVAGRSNVSATIEGFLTEDGFDVDVAYGTEGELPGDCPITYLLLLTGLPPEVPETTTTAAPTTVVETTTTVAETTTTTVAETTTTTVAETTTTAVTTTTAPPPSSGGGGIPPWLLITGGGGLIGLGLLGLLLFPSGKPCERLRRIVNRRSREWQDAVHRSRLAEIHEQEAKEARAAMHERWLDTLTVDSDATEAGFEAWLDPALLDSWNEAVAAAKAARAEEADALRRYLDAQKAVAQCLKAKAPPPAPLPPPPPAPPKPTPTPRPVAPQEPQEPKPAPETATPVPPPSERSCKIEVVAIDATWIPGFKHAMIVFTDQRGNQRYIEAGPSSSILLAFGKIAIASGAYTADRCANFDLEAPRVTILEGPEACAKWACIRKAAGRFKSLDLDYDIDRTHGLPWLTDTTKTCNTFVASVLRWCGLPVRRPEATLGGWAYPGWETPIDDPAAEEGSADR